MSVMHREKRVQLDGRELHRRGGCNGWKSGAMKDREIEGGGAPALWMVMGAGHSGMMRV